MHKGVIPPYETRAIARIVAPYMTLEMLALWFVESLLVIGVLYILLLGDWSHSSGLHQVDLRTLGHAVLCTLTISVTSVMIGLYRADICVRRGKFIITALIGSALLTPALIGLDAMFGLGLSFDLQGSVCLPKVLAGWIVCLGVTRVGFHLAQRFDLFTRHVMVAGSEQSAVRIQNIIDASAGGFCRVAGILPPDVAFGRSAMHRQRIWGVVVADDAPSGVLSLPRSVQVFDEAAFCETRLQRLDTAALPEGWGAVVARSAAGQWMDVVHRALDIICSFGLLLVTLPLVVLAALAIKAESPGPVFYCQERVGRHGRVFMLRKFRSMVRDAEAVGAPVWAAQDDPRVTRIGRLMRRTRIDELPQVLNVLSGEMSFIGPRPERPHFVERLTALIPGYAGRTCLKPGITGWAQIKFPYGASVEDARMKLAYDLYYVKHRSLFLNLLILVSTVRVILFQEGSR